MKNSIIADTGFWYALINTDDQFHQQASQVLANLEHDLLSTWPVMTETCYLIQSRIGQQATHEFLESYQDGLFEIYDIKPQQIQRMVALMQKYANLPMDLADASLVILAEELGHGRILSTDQRDFNSYRWKNHQPFQNLLLPDS